MAQRNEAMKQAEIVASALFDDGIYTVFSKHLAEMAYG